MFQKLISIFRTGFLLNFWFYSRNHFDTITAVFISLFISAFLQFTFSDLQFSAETLSWTVFSGFFRNIIKNNSSTLANTHRNDKSSELPAQTMQILRIFLRICQLFKVLSQRPQDQRPNSNTFSG